MKKKYIKEKNISEYLINVSKVLYINYNNNNNEKTKVLNSFKQYLITIFQSDNKLNNLFNIIEQLIFKNKESTILVNKKILILYPIIFHFNPNISFKYIDNFLLVLQKCSFINDIQFLSYLFNELFEIFFKNIKEYDKELFYKKLLNYSLNLIEFNNNKSEEEKNMEKNEISLGCNFLCILIDKYIYFNNDKIINYLWNIISYFFNKKKFNFIYDIFYCTIKLIMVTKDKFKKYCNLCLFTILDYLTDDNWMIRKISIEIIFYLTKYCKKEIQSVKDNIIDFLNILKDDKVPEIKEICNKTINNIEETENNNIKFIDINKESQTNINNIENIINISILDTENEKINNSKEIDGNNKINDINEKNCIKSINDNLCIENINNINNDYEYKPINLKYRNYSYDINKNTEINIFKNVNTEKISNKTKKKINLSIQKLPYCNNYNNDFNNNNNKNKQNGKEVPSISNISCSVTQSDDACPMKNQKSKKSRYLDTSPSNINQKVKIKIKKKNISSLKTKNNNNSAINIYKKQRICIDEYKSKSIKNKSIEYNNDEKEKIHLNKNEKLNKESIDSKKILKEKNNNYKKFIKTNNNSKERFDNKININNHSKKINTNNKSYLKFQKKFEKKINNNLIKKKNLKKLDIYINNKKEKKRLYNNKDKNNKIEKEENNMNKSEINLKLNLLPLFTKEKNNNSLTNNNYSDNSKNINNSNEIRLLTEQLNSLYQGQNMLIKVINNLKDKVDNNYKNINDRLILFEENNNTINKLKTKNIQNDDKKLKLIKNKYNDSKFNDALLESIQNDIYLFEILPLIKNEDLKYINIILIEDIISRLSLKLPSILKSNNRIYFGVILSFFNLVVNSKIKLKIITKLNLEDSLNYIKNDYKYFQITLIDMKLIDNIIKSIKK